MSSWLQRLLARTGNGCGMVMVGQKARLDPGSLPGSLGRNWLTFEAMASVTGECRCHRCLV